MSDGTASTSTEADQMADAIRRLFSALLAVEGHLTTPYPDDPRWTPWSRFIDLPLRQAVAARDAYRAGQNGSTGASDA